MTEQERYENMVDEIIDLKNEIKDLQAENEELKTAAKGIAEVLHIVAQDDVTYRFLLNDAVERERVKQEAYKEFADRLKKLQYLSIVDMVVSTKEIDNLLKEMVGEDNEQSLQM